MTQVTAYRATILDYAGDPTVAGANVRLLEDGLLVVERGLVRECGPYAEVLPRVPGVPILDLTGRIITPGFVDGHVHYPQTAMIASYGEQLLEWLNTYTFPEERRFSDRAYADKMASVFTAELLRNGTTTAVVLCTVHPQSVDALADVASECGMRMILGKVLMDRNAPADLCDTAELAYSDSKALIGRHHGRGRLLYAITPRFAPTSSPAQLEAAAALHKEFPSTYIHSHLAENRAELEWVAALFPECSSYTDVYDRYGLLGKRSIFAHGIHLGALELETLAEAGAAIAFCPTSNLFLGSGLFPFSRTKAAGIGIALATDVGGGTSFSLLQTLSDAYKVLQLQGQSFSSHQGFYALTLGGACALGLDDKLGNFDPGKEADFVVLDCEATPLLQLRCSRALDWEDRLFALMMLGDDRTISATYVGGRCVHTRDA